MNNLIFIEGTERVNTVVERMRSFISDLPDRENNIKENWLSRIDSLIPEVREPFSIALAGEYDVGKSSIIKALTGLNVLIDSNVATSDVKIYTYSGMKLIDMPGTLSGIEEHDVLAYDAVADSDLLLYVITNELFNSSNIILFSETLKKLKKEHQCMLVVNQIDRVNLMERTIEEATAVMMEELAVRVHPFEIESLSPVFISSRNYIDSLDEDDAELKQELYESSRISHIKKELNRLCAENGLTGRLLRPLQSGLSLIDTINNHIEDEDNEYDVLNKYYKKQKRIYIDNKNMIRSKIMKIRIDIKKDILNLSIPIISAFENKVEPDEIEYAYDEADSKLNEIIDKLPQEIEMLLRDAIEELQEQLEEFIESPVASVVNNMINTMNIRIETPDMSKFPKKIPDSLKIGVRSGADDVSRFLAQNSDDLARQFTEVYAKVKKVKFKPYGKVKMKSTTGKVIGKAGKTLGYLAIGWDLYCNMKEVVDESKWNRQLKEFKAITKENFRNAAEKCDLMISDSIDMYLHSQISKKVEELDEKQQELIESDKADKRVKAELREIEGILNETISFINDANLLMRD